MSWWGGGEMSRRRAWKTHAGDLIVHFVAGKLPALAGFGPLGHLDLQLARVDEVIGRDAEPREAICLMAELRESPLGSFSKRAGSSPPSPELLLAPMRFIATAKVSCASLPSAPKDIAPVVNRLTSSAAGSTSSSGTPSTPCVSSSLSSPRRVEGCACSSSTSRRIRGNSALLPRATARGPPAEAWRSFPGSTRDARRGRGNGCPRPLEHALGRGGVGFAWLSISSRATSSRPMPSMREGVPVKYWSTSFRLARRPRRAGSRSRTGWWRSPSWRRS